MTSEVSKIEKLITANFKTIIVVILLVGLALFAFFGYLYTQQTKVDSLKALTGADCVDSKAVELVKPNIVKVINTYSGGSSVGTGFFDKSGNVVTNSHVIETKGDISLGFGDNTTSKATLLANDKEKDIAIVKSEKKGSAVVWGDSTKLKQPDTLIAIGFPLGLPGEATVTKGSFSARRDDSGVNYIQTDTAITHGNSGGPLINLCGEVVGINSLGIESTALNFAISSESAQQVIGELLKNPKIEYGEQAAGNQNQNTNATSDGYTQKPTCKSISSTSAYGGTNKVEAGKTAFPSLSVTNYASVQWTGSGTFNSTTTAFPTWSSNVVGNHSLTATAKNSKGQCSLSLTIEVTAAKSSSSKTVTFAQNRPQPFNSDWVEVTGYNSMSINLTITGQITEFALHYTNNPNNATDTTGFTEQKRISCYNLSSCYASGITILGNYYRISTGTASGNVTATGTLIGY